MLPAGINIRTVTWRTMPGGALAWALLQGGPGWPECVPYVFIVVLPHPLFLIPSLTGHGFLLGEEVGGGMGGGMSRRWVWCGSDLTSMHVEMYWLSPPVGLRLICNSKTILMKGMETNLSFERLFV
jgi:hypothetical protein